MHATPGRYCNLHGDEDTRDYTPRELQAIEDEAARLVAERLSSREWWDEHTKGENAATATMPETLARAMSNLDNACKGDRIATDAILTALSNLQRQARADAQAEARAAAERAMEMGEL